MSLPSASLSNKAAAEPFRSDAVTPVSPDAALIASLRFVKSVVVTVAVTVVRLEDYLVAQF